MTQKFYRLYGLVIVITLVLGIVAGLCAWIASSSEPSFAKLVMEKYAGETAELEPFSDKIDFADEFRLVRLENVLGDISLRIAKDGKTHLLVEGRMPKGTGIKPYGYRTEQRTLSVKAETEKNGRGFHFSWNDVSFGSSSSPLSMVLEVPATFRGDAELRTVNGELSVAGISGGRVQLKAVNGEVNVDVASSWQKIEAETVNGDITIDATCFDQRLKSVAGDIEVAAPKNGNWDVNVKTVSGDVTNDLPRAGGGTTGILQAKTISWHIKLSAWGR